MTETSAGTDERPVHHEYDCSSGETTLRPVSDEEWAAMREREAEAVAAEQAAAADDEALRTAVAGHPDPVVQALAKRLGLA